MATHAKLTFQLSCSWTSVCPWRLIYPNFGLGTTPQPMLPNRHVGVDDIFGISDGRTLTAWFPSSGQHSYFDIKLPYSDWYLETSMKKMYCKRAEGARRSLYNERILNIEQWTFCPLVFSVTCGAGPEAKTFMRMIYDKIAKNSLHDYSSV